jgi:hypothetical protein
VERERIEKEQAKKEQNQSITQRKKGIAPLPDEEDIEPAEEGNKVRKTRRGKEKTS